MSEKRFSAQNEPAARAAPGRPARRGELAVGDDLTPRESRAADGELALQRRRPVEIEIDVVVRGRSPAGARQSAGTDPARPRHDRVADPPLAFRRGPGAPRGGGWTDSRNGHVTSTFELTLGSSAGELVLDDRRRRVPTPRRRPSRAPRRGVASRAHAREYNRRDERPRHLPSARCGQRADQELRTRLARAGRAAGAARADVGGARPRPDGDRRQSGSRRARRSRPSCRTAARTCSPTSRGAAPRRSSARSPRPAPRTRHGRGRRGTSGSRCSSAPPS